MSIASTGLGHDERRACGLKPLSVSARTAAEVTGLSIRTIWALIKDGELDVKRVGGRTLVRFESLERLISSTPASAAEAAAP